MHKGPSTRTSGNENDVRASSVAIPALRSNLDALRTSHKLGALRPEKLDLEEIRGDAQELHWPKDIQKFESIEEHDADTAHEQSLAARPDARRKTRPRNDCQTRPR